MPERAELSEAYLSEMTEIWGDSRGRFFAAIRDLRRARELLRRFLKMHEEDRHACELTAEARAFLGEP